MSIIRVLIIIWITVGVWRIVTKVLNSTHDKKCCTQTQLIVFTWGPDVVSNLEGSNPRFGLPSKFVTYLGPQNYEIKTKRVPNLEGQSLRCVEEERWYRIMDCVMISSLRYRYPYCSSEREIWWISEIQTEDQTWDERTFQERQSRLS
jgi:hypothetical protein